MRLVNYGVGEMVDRLTVLSLKVLYAGAAGKPTDHFEQERNVLLTGLRSRSTINSMWYEQALGLGAVNAALWHLEDELRQWRRQQTDPETVDLPEARDIVGVAFRIQQLNDVRADLIEAINKSTGDHLGTEKLT